MIKLLPLFLLAIICTTNKTHAEEKNITADLNFNNHKTQGLQGSALNLNPTTASKKTLNIDNLPFNQNQDFSLQFWVRTTADANQKFTLLSQKLFPDNSLKSQKNKGFVFYHSHGTWAWNIGSGNRRLTYERDNGSRMPLNDGRWHQLAMTYEKQKSTLRLFYDGINWVTYNINDDTGFKFQNDQPLTLGGTKTQNNQTNGIINNIIDGQKNLQTLLNISKGLGCNVQTKDLTTLVIAPQKIFNAQLGTPKDQTKKQARADALDKIKKLKSKLYRNHYTVYQVADYMKVSKLRELYYIKDGKIHINPIPAQKYTNYETLSNANCDIDNLKIYSRTISPKEVQTSYAKHFKSKIFKHVDNLKKLTAATWNIHHGGIHETVTEDGWDSRIAIVNKIKKENLDIIMMQETYSNGDFIAAQLGYYFATTIDWDYLGQGANPSVLSKYPIEDIDVPKTSSFMNVSAKIKLSNTQKIYAMSNWYGMNNFPKVAKFHEQRFKDADNIPVIFAGDFNAVPHTDGGKNPASVYFQKAGFIDAYRNKYPNPKTHPGHTHDENVRIDQVYYKGKGLKNTSTTIEKTFPSIFPSDHYIIKSIFKLNYKSKN